MRFSHFCLDFPQRLCYIIIGLRARLFTRKGINMNTILNNHKKPAQNKIDNFKSSYKPYTPDGYFFRDLPNDQVYFPVAIELIKWPELSFTEILTYCFMRDNVVKNIEDNDDVDYYALPWALWKIPNERMSKAMGMCSNSIYKIGQNLSQTTPPLMYNKVFFTLDSLKLTQEMFEGETFQVPYRAFFYTALNPRTIFFYFYLLALYKEPEKHGMERICKQDDFLILQPSEQAKRLNIDEKTFNNLVKKLSSLDLIEVYQARNQPSFYKPLVSLEDF